MSIGGSSSKSRSSTNQTQTNTLSDRAVNMLNQGITEVGGKSYQALDPNAFRAYESPYTEQVIDASLAQMDQRGAIARNQQNGDMAAAGAFGDKRRGIYEAELAAQQGRDRASLISGLRQQGFDRAQDVAVGENARGNEFSLAIQGLLNQLRSGFLNEGTQKLDGVTKGKSSGVQFGFKYGG